MTLASYKQYQCILALASEARVNADETCLRLFGCRADETSAEQASDFIALMKGKAIITVGIPLCYFESPRVQLVADQIKNRIPQSHRNWNPEKKHWSFRPKHLATMVRIALQFRYAEIVHNKVRTDLKSTAVESHAKSAHSQQP